MLDMNPQEDSLMEEITTWSEKGSIPAGRSGHRISCNDDSFLYCIGGYNPTEGPLKEAWRLNISTGEWEELSKADESPESCVSHCMVSVGQELLTFGGTGFPFGSAMSNDIYACHKTNGEWRIVEAEGEIPPKLYGQACRRLGDYVYTVGGTSGYHFTLQAYAFHLPTQTWSCLASNDLFKGNEPYGRYKAEIGVLPGKIVVVGGSAANNVFSLDEVPVLNINSGIWEVYTTKSDPRLNAFPGPRKCHSSVQMGTDLYITGGTNGDEVYSDIWKLNLVTLQWSKLSLVLPVPLYFHAAAITQNGCLYVYGGSSSIGSSERSSAVYRARLQAPPLLEVAWNAFAVNCPTISTPVPRNEYLNQKESSHTSMDLLAAGVPKRFIQRLKKLSVESKNH